MNSIPTFEVFTIIYTLVDDWYLENASDYRKGRPGKKPEFRDSEVIT